MTTVGLTASITGVTITNVTGPPAYQSVVFTATNSFNVGDGVTITGITPSTLNVASAQIASRTSTTFTVLLNAATVSGTFSSAGLATTFFFNKTSLTDPFVPTHSFTENVIDSIGLPASVNSVYQSTDSVYDIAISGKPFYLAASNAFPYHRETASYKRQQLDLTQQPGEQTFEGWWLRSQGSWHLGAGINYLEPLQGQDVIYRFKKSVGIDPWTLGEITLLRDTTKIMTLSDGIDVMGAIDGSNVTCVFVYNGAVLYRVLADGTYATVNYYGAGAHTNPIQSMTNDGINYYIVTASGIYQGPLTNASNGALIWSAATSGYSTLSWAKQRLMAAIGTDIYQILNVAGTWTGTKLYTNPTSNWQFTGIAEGPGAIYFSGYSGMNSSIIKLNLDTSGAVATLTSAVTAADFPDEEHITSIGAYLGKFILIGTNKGIRVGIVDTSAYGNGYITYGPLSYTNSSNLHVTKFAFRDRFAFATVSNDIDGNSGLVRIDLSQQLSDGRFAWTYDLNANISGQAQGVAPIGESGRMCFAVANQGLYFEHATQKVASGYLDTGAIRYNTMEKKHFKLVKIRPKLPMDASIAVSAISKNGSINSIITLANEVQADQDLGTNLASPQEQLSFRFTLYRSSADASTGAGMVGYQIKALPANKRTRSISIPLMCYDFESDRFNIATGYEGRAWERLSALENIESTGDTVTIQDFTTGEQVEALIEKITFDRVSPPDRRFQGFGGIVYVQVRTT